MSCNYAIEVTDVSKSFRTYAKPSDRLKQFVYGRFEFIKKQGGKYYRDFSALKSVSLSIKKGETVGIVGRNGSGKSTILQVICGTLNPDSGKVVVSGKIAALLELGSGFNPEYSGRENVYLNAAVLGLTKDETDNVFSKIHDFSGIGDFIDQPVKTYSSGMVVRLAFAVAINIDPDVLIIDEALAVGDELFQRKCYSRIEEIKRNGATILFVSHSASAIVELCDRAVLFDQGEILGTGDPKVVVSNYQKLLYAPMEKTHGLREEIKLALSESALPVVHEHSNALPQKKTTNPSLVTSFYDPNLQTTSIVEFNGEYAKIYEPKIFNNQGEQVNNLVHGEEYTYCYSVKFYADAQYVRFGMLIKTMTGFELAGACTSLPSDSIERVSAGKSISVKFKFRCLANAGTYFFNAGILAERDGIETYLHRVIDAYPFRVIPEAGQLATGLVNFDVESEIVLL
ncbi:ABC transporter ATP-binding protein [Aeromonas veronii]